MLIHCLSKVIYDNKAQGIIFYQEKETDLENKVEKLVVFFYVRCMRIQAT